MKTRDNILDSLIRLFVASQDEIREVRNGSVIRGILYSIASELEDVYGELDTGLLNLYIDKATGKYLDALIQGFIGLERKKATRSIGYVLMELGEPIDDTNIDKLFFSFSRYNYESDSLETEFNGSIKYLVSPTPGQRVNLTVVQPQSIKTERSDFLNDPQTGIQPLFSQYKEFIRSVYTSTGKPVRYLILPVATVETGKATILKTTQAETFINIGIPARVVNLYIKQNAELDSYSVVDADGVAQLSVSPYPDSIFLGDFSNITGGEEQESDEAYRSRYYAYLDSLSKGTSAAIEFGIKSGFPSIDIRSISTNQPGEVDIVVFAKKPVTPNIVSSMEQLLEAYRPVGIKLNIFTAKTISLTALMDVVSNNNAAAVEKIRNELSLIVDNKDVGETLAYTEIHEGLDLPEISTLHNVFYGMELNEYWFGLYSNTLTNVYSKIIPSLGTYTYASVYTEILNNPQNVRLFDSASGLIGYPLLEFVRAAKKVPDPTVLSPSLSALVTSIQSCAVGIRDIECLQTLPLGTVVTLQDLIELLGEEAAIYYRIKLLTLPNINHLQTSVAEPLIERVLLNDVVNLTNLDSRPVTTKDFEKIVLSTNPLVSKGIYKNPEMVGVRKYEPID